MSIIERMSPVEKTLSATLRGVAGHTGSGWTSLLALKSGRKAMAVKLRGVAGLRADFVCNGQIVAVLGCEDGVAKGFLDSAGDRLPAGLEAGDLIQIRQNNDIILQGVLEKSRSVSDSLIILLRMMKRIMAGANTLTRRAH